MVRRREDRPVPKVEKVTQGRTAAPRTRDSRPFPVDFLLHRNITKTRYGDRPRYFSYIVKPKTCIKIGRKGETIWVLSDCTVNFIFMVTGPHHPV